MPSGHKCYEDDKLTKRGKKKLHTSDSINKQAVARQRKLLFKVV